MPGGARCDELALERVEMQPPLNEGIDRFLSNTKYD